MLYQRTIRIQLYSVATNQSAGCTTNQSPNLRGGFLLAVRREAMPAWGVSAPELRQMVCGFDVADADSEAKDFDVRESFRVVMDEVRGRRRWQKAC